MSNLEWMSLVDRHDFRTLFIDQLGWSNPDQAPISVEIEGHTFWLTQVAGYKGLRVWYCNEVPSRKVQRLIDETVGVSSHERLVIFASEAVQEWRWPRRAQLGGANAKLVVHQHVAGAPDPRLGAQLSSIAIDFEAELTLFELLSRMRTAFDVEAELASVQAARLMGTLYAELETAEWGPHDATSLLARLLFLLFGDDSAMWEAELFQRFVAEHTTADSLTPKLRALFEVLNTDKPLRTVPTSSELFPFPYINGGLFEDELEFKPLSSGFRDALLSAGQFDWSAISPAVFGSMFQTVKDRDSRRHGGEHYTTEKNILRTIDPLFLDEYRSRLARAWNDRGQLTRLHNDLGRIRVFDPACGCGNFLIIAYRELRALELDLLLRQRDLDVEQKNQVHAQLSLDVTGDIKVTLDHFFGIEIEEWPARIAETAMLLVDHLANQRMEQDFGLAPDRLPIRIAPTILKRNALRVDWKLLLAPSDDVIVVGNPPFVAMHKMSEDQQEDRALAFAEVPESKGQRTGRLDYVSSWVAKSFAYARGTKARIAFVSTNSLMQGDSARALDPIFRSAGFDISFAYTSFRWETEARDGAVVHCVIVGFGVAGSVRDRKLYDFQHAKGEPTERSASHINCYLLDTDLEGPAKRSVPLIANLPPMSKGSQPTDGGNLLVDEEDFEEVSADPVASQFLRSWAQSAALLDGERKWCLWMVGSTAKEREGSELLAARLERVEELRRKSPTPSVKSAASTPWLFTQLRQPSKTWLGVPRHSSENRIVVPMMEMSPSVVAGDALAYIEGCPRWVFVYLQSSAFTDWIRTFSGALKSSFRISPDMTYNVFPFVRPEGELLVSFESAAAQLLDARSELADQTLASLYDRTTMPTSLRSAHAHIDKLVDGVYGLEDPSGTERAVALLAKHHEILSSAMLPTGSRRRRLTR